MSTYAPVPDSSDRAALDQWAAAYVRELARVLGLGYAEITRRVGRSAMVDRAQRNALLLAAWDGASPDPVNDCPPYCQTCGEWRCAVTAHAGHAPELHQPDHQGRFACSRFAVVCTCP